MAKKSIVIGVELTGTSFQVAVVNKKKREVLDLFSGELGVDSISSPEILEGKLQSYIENTEYDLKGVNFEISRNFSLHLRKTN